MLIFKIENTRFIDIDTLLDESITVCISVEKKSISIPLYQFETSAPNDPRSDIHLYKVKVPPLYVALTSSNEL